MTSPAPFPGADRAENVRPSGALVVRSAGPRAAFRPAAGDGIHLPDARVRHGPRTGGGSWRTPATTAPSRFRPEALCGPGPARPEVFLKIIDGRLVPRMVARTCRDLPAAERPRFTTHRRLAERDAELFPYPVRKIGQAPAHHLVDRRYRSALDERRPEPDAGRRQAWTRLTLPPGTSPTNSTI